MRLDLFLVEHGHAPTRERAKRLIEEGHVTVPGVDHPKPSTPMPDDAAVTVQSELAYVSRGGDKLAAALEEFRLQIDGCVCLDVGASTGGFTDCLLQKGARRVVAVDVGEGQMVPELAADPRVELREKINAREMKPGDFQEPFDLAVIDVSFISLDKVLPAIIPLLAPEGRLLCLIKPQFEAGKHHLGKGGVIRDRKVHRLVLQRHGELLAGLGLTGIHLAPSARTGRSGNLEFWSLSGRPPVGGTREGEGVPVQTVTEVVRRAHLKL